MSDFLENYCDNLFRIINSIKVVHKTDKVLSFTQGVNDVCRLVMSQADSGNKIIFIGNGGSAAIASHMAIDFWKNGKVKAVSFNDASQLTCLGNDYGYEHVFDKPIEMFADPGDVLIAISSSGKSENILLGTQAACKKGCKIITLSGFDENNPLSMLGEYNFYVPSNSYGYVEVSHHSICHCIIDMVMKMKNE